MNRVKWSLFLLFILVSFHGWSAIDVFHFDSAEQERSFMSINQMLRCPKCQNSNISDSNSQLAHDIRKKVYELLQDGQSQKQIINYMRARYGDFIVYSPELNLSTAILWCAPVCVIVFGIMIAGLSLRNKNRQKIKEDADELSNKEQHRLHAILSDDLSKRTRGR